MDILKFKFLFVILIIVIQCSANIITTINQIEKRTEFIDHSLSSIKILEYKDIDFTQYDNILPHIESTLFMGLATVNLKQYIYKDETIKVDIVLEGRIAVVNAQYYYQDKQPFYIFQKKSHFTKEHVKTNRIEYNKYYIQNNKLIRWIHNNKIQAVDTTKFLLEEKRVLRDANIYLNINSINTNNYIQDNNTQNRYFLEKKLK